MSSPFTDSQLDELARLFGRLQSDAGFGSTAEQVAARAAMGGVLFVARMLHGSDESTFNDFAEETLGISAPEVADLINHAVGDEDDTNTTISNPIIEV